MDKEKTPKERMYELLLKKYSQIISEQETRTIAEMKQMIDKNDLTIKALVSDFKEPTYSFEEDYLKTAKKIFEFLIKEIDCVKIDININFWLKPNEILSAKVADPEDFGVLFCSVLYALGDSDAYVLVFELENLEVHSCVVADTKKEFVLFDFCSKKYLSGKKPVVLEKYSFKNAKIRRLLYRFNSKIYEQFV